MFTDISSFVTVDCFQVVSRLYPKNAELSVRQPNCFY